MKMDRLCGTLSVTGHGQLKQTENLVKQEHNVGEVVTLVVLAVKLAIKL
jgi:hypothetical protein